MRILTIEQAERLERILYKTKSKRIKKKVISRISKGTQKYLLKWLDECNEQEIEDKTIGGIVMPSSSELIGRYGGRHEN